MEEQKAITSDTVVEGRVEVVVHEDGVEPETLSLEDSGFQRNFFTEARNKQGTFATVVISYTHPAVTNMNKAPEATVFLNTRIQPGIFGGKSVFEVSIITDGTNRQPEITIAAIEHGASHHCCSSPVVSWTGSTSATSQLSDEGRLLLAGIHREYKAAITGFIEEVVAYIRASGASIETAPTEEDKEKLINGFLHDDNQMWELILDRYTRKDDGCGDESTWIAIVTKYRERYLKPFHEHSTTREDFGYFSAMFSVDFYDGNVINQAPNAPSFLHKVSVPRGDDVGEHQTGNDMRQQYGPSMPNIRFRSVRHYNYKANTKSTDGEHIYPYLQSTTVLYQAPDSSCIAFPNISVGIEIQHNVDGDDTQEWPSVEATVPWEDLAKSMGILTSQGLLFPSEDIASQLGLTISSESCLNVPSTVRYPFDAWTSKFQAGPIWKVHATVLYPTADIVPTESPPAILSRARGDTIMEETEEEEKKEYPEGTSMSITPEHSLITVNILERQACSYANPERVRKYMDMALEERNDEPMPQAVVPF